MRIIRYRIVRRYAPGLNVFVIQVSILWMPWVDLTIDGERNHATMENALSYIPNAYKKLPDFKIDLKVWPLKHYINTEL
jgi:hypothetical protein